MARYANLRVMTASERLSRSINESLRKKPSSPMKNHLISGTSDFNDSDNNIVINTNMLRSSANLSNPAQSSDDIQDAGGDGARGGLRLEKSQTNSRARHSTTN